AALAGLCDRLGGPRWRGAPIRDAGWDPAVDDVAAIRQLPPPLPGALSGATRFSTAAVVGQTEADAGRTVKLLCRLDDGQTVETVAMHSPAVPGSRRRATVCVSTQVGCAVGCPFCATGALGLRRSCTAAEIVDQVRAAPAAPPRRGLGPVTHAVYMGMGEPLANYEATVESL